jgi:hypothetical protein
MGKFGAQEERLLDAVDPVDYDVYEHNDETVEGSSNT